MIPTKHDLFYVENAVTGYCELNGICISISHDCTIYGSWISRFRISDQLHASIIVRWEDLRPQECIDDIINATCRGIYNDWTRLKLDKIDITKEMDLLRRRRCNTIIKEPAICTISKVIFNDPATIVFWSDGTKTVVKVQEGDIFDPEKGLAMAFIKKTNGNVGAYYNTIKKWLPKINEEET